jgi:hypothetical protein
VPNPVPDIDVAALSASIREGVPSCASAILVGSAAVGRGGCVADLDVTGLDASVPIGEDRSHAFSHGRWPVHCVLYHPSHFLAVTEHPDLLFLFFREVRKLLEGIPLFDDDGSLGRTLAHLRAVRAPLAPLAPLVRAVGRYRVRSAERPAGRLGFFRAVETLAYAWMHLDIRYRYTKPKWLMADAALVESDALSALLGAVSDELVAAHPLRELAGALAPAVMAAPGKIGSLAGDQLRDARSLLEKERCAEAVWPLRMATYMLAQSLAASHGVRYRDVRSVAAVIRRVADADPATARSMRAALLLGTPVAPGVRELWVAARREFLAAWKRRGGEAFTPSAAAAG